jgi:hypothetical protein
MSKVPIQCNCKQQYVVSNILIIIATHNLLSWGKGGEGGGGGGGYVTITLNDVIGAAKPQIYRNQ